MEGASPNSTPTSDKTMNKTTDETTEDKITIDNIVVATQADGSSSSDITTSNVAAVVDEQVDADKSDTKNSSAQDQAAVTDEDIGTEKPETKSTSATDIVDQAAVALKDNTAEKPKTKSTTATDISDQAVVIGEGSGTEKSNPVANTEKSNPVADTESSSFTDISSEAAVIVERINAEKTNIVAAGEDDRAQDGEVDDNQPWKKLVDGEAANNQQWSTLVQQLVESVEKSQDDQGQQEILLIVEDSQPKENKVGDGDAQVLLENGAGDVDHKNAAVTDNKEDQAQLHHSETQAAPSSNSPMQDVEMESMSEFRCWYCEEVFDTNAEREDHEKMHTESRYVLLICQQCGQSFRKSEDFETHHQICGMDNDEEGDSLNDGDLSNSVGGENSISPVDSHLDVQQDQLECVFCDTRCNSREVFKEHLVLKHQMVNDNNNPKFYCCKFCETNLPDREMMIKHEATHKVNVLDVNAKFPCTFCGKNCQSKRNLVEHQRMHTGEKPFSCPHCGKSFSRERDVKEHIKRMHLGNVGKQLTCEYCFVIFVTRKDLIDHLQNIHNVMKLPIPSITNVNDTNYICSECGKEFNHKSKRQFEEHIATHTRDNLFTCDECGKTFVRARELRYHKARHRGEGRYVCGLCHKNFVLKWDLKKHLKIMHDIDEDGSFDRPPPEKRPKLVTINADHTTVMDDIFKVNPYICRVCHAQFEGGKELRAHRKTHMEEEGDVASEGSSFPYICSFCSKGFQNKNDFVEHVGTHTKGTYGEKYVPVASPAVKRETVNRESASPPFRKPKKQLEKGEGVEFWKCCYGACLRLMTVYNSKEEFQEHIKTHMKEHTNICEFCGRCFARTRDLAYHKKESGVRPCKYMYLNVTAQDNTLSEAAGTENSATVSGENSQQSSSTKKPVLIAPKPPPGSIIKVTIPANQANQSKPPPSSTNKAPIPADSTNWHTCGCGTQVHGFKDFQLHVLSHKSTKGSVFCQYCGKQFKKQDNLQNHLKEDSEKPCAYASFVINGKEPPGSTFNVDSEKAQENASQQPNGSSGQATSVTKVIAGGGNPTNNGSTVLVGNGAHSMNMVLVQPIKLELAKNVTVLPANLIPVQTIPAKAQKAPPPSGNIDKPYPCSYCGKAFRARSYVREHETLHTKEANFPCEVCDRRFTRARELRYHMQKHTGSEPFKCDICGKRFLTHSNFRTHIEKEHEAEPDPEESVECEDTVDDTNVNLGNSSFKCTFCSKHFTLLDHFKAHMEIVHDVEVSVVSPDEIPNIDKVVDKEEDKVVDKVVDS